MEEQTKKKSNGVWWVVAFLVFRFFIIEHFAVPSSSMTPTLLTGDIILIKKYAYSYSRQSLPFGGYLPFWKQGIKLGSPTYGDVVVFTLPRDPSTYYVKRVVGLPGDRVQMIDGNLYVNGQLCNMKFDSNFTFRTDAGEYETGKKYQRTFYENKKQYHIFRDKPFGSGHIDNTLDFTVKDNCVWLAGDYATGSRDSFDTHFMGSVPIENLSGKVFFVLYGTNSRLKPESSWIKWIIQLPWRILVALKETNFKRIGVSVE
jgi:signal peptidase I